MTVLTRVASIASMTLALAGLIATSAPSLAQEVSQSATTIPAFTTLNTPAPTMVPAVEPAAPATPAIEEPSFDSLDEAVAAQDVTAADEAMRCLAGAIYFESKGEPLAGQLAVAQVIINRAKSGRFPADVCGVVKQRGQFSFVRGGEIPAVNEAARPWRTAVAVARVAMADMWKAAAPKALYFNTPDRAPAGRLMKIAAIGNHVFYR